MSMSLTVAVADDSLELLDIEPAVVNSLRTLHIDTAADVPVRDTTSSGPRSLLVRQQKPGSHGNANNDDNSDDDDDYTGNVVDDDDDETVGAGDAKLAVVQPGDCIICVFLLPS